jgi:leucyl/phenylalanyl-tRNA---protein transferase
MQIILLDPNSPDQNFPPPQRALENPNGLLAVGGCLSPQRLINAYRNGIFPWYNSGEPILWWSPNPRLVLFPEQLHISSSLRKTLRKNLFEITVDRCFDQVMQACAESRAYAEGTWINQEMKSAYHKLHRMGIAHSIEVWEKQELVGGLYGVAIGKVFFGESMFYTRTNASKVAFVKLVDLIVSWGYKLIDCQVHTTHLVTLGAKEVDRNEFIFLLSQYCPLNVADQAWQR